jgi:arabinofuranosyltransferase
MTTIAQSAPSPVEGAPEKTQLARLQSPVRFLWPVLFLVSMLFFFFLSAVYKSVRIDDTYITFRYSWNIAHGFGVRWNPGERAVEGCTEFLWMLASAAAIKLGFVPLVAAQILGFLCSLVTVLLPLTPLNRVSTTWRSRLLASSLLAIAPAFAFYGVSGMGHPLFTLLFTVAVLMLHRGLVDGERKALLASGFLFGVSTLARPEGFEFCLVALGILAVSLLLGRVTLRNVIAFVLAYLVLYVPYTGWRLAYYGYFFPNTYYAKHTGGFLVNLPSGFFYLSTELTVYGAVALVCCIIAILPRERTVTAINYFKQEAPNLSLLLFVLVIMAYSTLLGGDDSAPFPSVRLLTPALPILYILTSQSIERLFPTRNVVHAILGLSVLVLLFLSQTNDNFALVKFSHSTMVGTDSPLSVVKTAFRKPPASNYEVSPMVQWMNATLPDHCTVAIPWAGVAGWMNKCTLIDEDGLNDLHIAHLPKRQRGNDVKGDPDYILSRHPDLIFINIDAQYGKTKTFTQAGGWRLTDKDMADKLMHSNVYKQITYPGNPDVLVFKRTY